MSEEKWFKKNYLILASTVMLLIFAREYLFFAVLAVITIAYIYGNTPPADRKFLILIFFSGMIIRCCLSVFLTNMSYLYIYGGKGFVSGDDRLYAVTALEISKNIMNNEFVYKIMTFGFNLYTYILGIFYTVFGYKLITSKFINCYIGAVIPVMAYYIATQLSDNKAAQTHYGKILVYGQESPAGRSRGHIGGGLRLSPRHWRDVEVNSF